MKITRQPPPAIGHDTSKTAGECGIFLIWQYKKLLKMNTWN